MFFSAGAQIVEVDVAVVGGLAARHRHDFHPGHHGAGRVGAVRRYRDQADVALHVAAAFVVTANRQQPGEFALRAGVRLERHGGKARDRRQPAFELLKKFLVAQRLANRRERVQRGEAWPTDREHLGGGVELHRARAKRNHRRRERQVACLQFLEVAQHLRLRMVLVENRVREKIRSAPQRLGNGNRLTDGQLKAHRLAAVENRQQVGQVGRCHCLVERDADTPGAELPKVDPPFLCLGNHAVRRLAKRDSDRVEKMLRLHRLAKLPQAVGQRLGLGVDASADLPQPVGAVVHGVHRGDVGQQRLRGADVARGLVAADVLLACLQRQPQGRAAVRVLGHADDPARQPPLVFVPCGDERRVRAAVAHRHAETLRAADGDVRAEFAGRLDLREHQQVGRDDGQRVVVVCACNEPARVGQRAVGGRVLQHHGKHRRAEVELVRIAGDDPDADRLGARAQHGER